MKLKSLLIIGLIANIPAHSFGIPFFGKKKPVYIPVVAQQQKKESRLAEWKKRWTCSEYTALLTGGISAAGVFRLWHDIGTEGRNALGGLWANMGYGIETAITALPRYIFTGNPFGQTENSLLYNFLGNRAIAGLMTIGVFSTAVATPLFLRSPLGYTHRAKWNLDLIESYYLNKSDDLLQSISITQKKDLEKRLAHVRRMLVLGLPGVGVAKVIDKPWLPTYNPQKTAQYIQELKNRYMQYANHLIAVIPHLSVEVGF